MTRAPASILLVGGMTDPNLQALADCATGHGATVIDLRGAPGALPDIAFDPATRELLHDGAPLSPTAAFVRPDVFTKSASPYYQASMAAIARIVRAWLAVRDGVASFNRDGFGRSLSVNKGAALAAAVSVGFRIPPTRIGNTPDQIDGLFKDTASVIQKPVGGGDLCRALDRADLTRRSTIPPVIAQERIAGADLRVFRIGAAFEAFELRSVKLDYRDDTRPRITPVAADAALCDKLRALTDQMGLTWSASDFKLCPDRGPVYLETNANPMFAAFDRASGGALVEQMCHALGVIAP